MYSYISQRFQSLYLITVTTTTTTETEAHWLEQETLRTKLTEIVSVLTLDKKGYRFVPFRATSFTSYGRPFAFTPDNKRTIKMFLRSHNRHFFPVLIHKKETG